MIYATDFPAVGHKYLVDFQQFKVILDFTSITSMTFTGVGADGSTGTPTTVVIDVEPIRDGLFLVTWQEEDKTTVVHLEDYKKETIITCITGSDGSFEKFHGTVKLIS
jgi:hypothetical protein